MPLLDRLLPSQPEERAAAEDRLRALSGLVFLGGLLAALGLATVPPADRLGPNFSILGPGLLAVLFMVVNAWLRFRLVPAPGHLLLLIFVTCLATTCFNHLNGSTSDATVTVFVLTILVATVYFTATAGAVAFVLFVVLYGGMILLEARGVLLHAPLFPSKRAILEISTNFRDYFLSLTGINALALVFGIYVSRTLRQQQEATHRAHAELQRAHTELERRVEERTAALREANRSLEREVEGRQALEAHLVESQKLEAVGRLAGGVSHHFNNLLAVILGNVALAREESIRGTPAVEPLSAAEAACGRAKSLTTQLLTLAERVPAIRETESVADLVRELVDLTLVGSDITCELDLPGPSSPPLEIEVETGRFQRAIDAVIQNAREATGTGGSIRVRIRPRTLATDECPPLEDGEYVSIEVRDEGPGIEPEDQAKVFDPFFSRKNVGRGLGLSTARAILQAHGGWISVRSRPGEGTTVQILVPRFLEKPVERPEPEPVPEAPVDETVPIRGEGRVHFMDDDPDIRKLVCRMIGSLGYEVTASATGEEAIEEYRKALDEDRAFDVVVLDRNVPSGLGAIQTLPRLLELDPGARVVLTSGYGGDSILTDYASEGFAAAIAKPFDLVELSRTLHELTHDAETT